MAEMNNMFEWMFLIVGLVCLYFALMGKGMAYNNQLPKEVKEASNKLLRIFLWIFGGLLTVQGVLDVVDLTTPASLIVFFVLIGTAFVTYIVLFYKRFGKIIKAQEKKEINKTL